MRPVRFPAAQFDSRPCLFFTMPSTNVPLVFFAPAPLTIRLLQRPASSSPPVPNYRFSISSTSFIPSFPRPNTLPTASRPRSTATASPIMASSLIKGTSLTVRFSRVVDGDTLRVFLPGAEKDESVRVLVLDTEESYAGSSKPVSPWGKEAKTFAQSFFEGAQSLTIEFPGTEPVDQAIVKHRGNFGRLLVFVYKDGIDFQQTMIRKGYSPYFNKYGNANFPGHHARYVAAERAAQVDNIGVWDQLTVNGSVVRNYPALQVWWNLRAKLIDEYRALKAADKTVYNSRLDHEKLIELATAGANATVFTEVSNVRRVSGSIGIIGIGSPDRPFTLKIPDMDSIEGRRLLTLLGNRYISESEDKPRRGYCYVTGRMELFRGNPQLEIANTTAVTDDLSMRSEITGPIPPPPEPSGETGDAAMTPVPDEEVGSVGDGVVEGVDLSIASLLPNPKGTDRGRETVTLRNRGKTDASLEGWTLKDSVGNVDNLNGVVAAVGTLKITLTGNGVRLNNTGDDVFLFDPNGILVSNVSYGEADAGEGQTIDFA